MLRPATPLSILLFASFVLLLISVISTPVIKGIPLARFDDVNFGVFGWCKDSGECSGFQVGWNTDEALPASNDDDFNLPSSTRHSLSSLLIVHPIAAFCNLIVLGLAVAAHFHSPSHSARYLLGLLILLLPTLLITLLAFLVDILLFVPHLQWGGWIVLASTILITASGVVTCAMRRTLVSRKARKKRIAENAEMSGANFYARQAEDSAIPPAPSTESKHAMVNGGPGTDLLPSFATYSSRQSEERPVNGPSPTDPVSAVSPMDHSRFYRGPDPRSRSTSRPRQEDFGAPLGAPTSFEDRPALPNHGSYGPSRARGGHPSRGPPPLSYAPGRGGHSNRGRGGPVPPGVMVPVSVTRRPPPGYGPQSPTGRIAYGPPPQNGPSVRPGDPNFGPPGPSHYSSDADAAYVPAYGARAQSPAQRRQSPYGSRAQSPAGGIPSQEMTPAMPPMPDQSRYAPMDHQYSATGIDSGVLGTVQMPTVRSHGQQSPHSPTLDYIPPRAGWNDTPQGGPGSHVPRKRTTSGGSDYVEDVDPKFAEPQPTIPNIPFTEQPAFDPHIQARQPQIPSLLMAGRNPNNPSPDASSNHIQIPREHSYEDLQPGARSPVESETSNFTSISQRPMNPDWQPGNGGEFNNLGPGARSDPRQQQRRHDALLNDNPDFALPGMGPPRAHPSMARGGYRGRGGYGLPRQGPTRPPPPSVLESMGADGRYPTPMPSQNGGGVMREI